MRESGVLDYEFADPGATRREVAELIRPPRRVRISEAAQELVQIDTPGGYSGPWSPRITPYMVKPMDTLSSRRYEAVVFTGPARTGKTEALVDCWIGHAVVNDPGDFLVVQMSQDMAQDFSERRIDRLHDNSPRIGRFIHRGSQDDNVFRKVYRHGMILQLAWPSRTQLASRDIRYVALTDYDAMPQEIGHHGSPFDLGRKRTQTYMSSGMTMVESNPRYEWSTDDWRPSSPHELPPAGGICALFNRGTREVWHFICPHCAEAYPPDFPEASYYELPPWWADDKPDYAALSDDEIETAAYSAAYLCPHCGAMEPAHNKTKLNARGVWVPDGCHVDEAGEVVGEVARSTIASFRLPAGAAAFQPLAQLVRAWLLANREFERTGDETALRGTTFQDQGRPYRSRISSKRRDAEDLMDRAEPSDHGWVPHGVRFLTAQVDVQGRHFAVMVTGWGVDLERWIIDRFDVTTSERLSLSGERDSLDPAAYAEDWRVLIDGVMARTYPLADGSGRRMAIKATASDSGGAVGVTAHAYAFSRYCAERGLSRRFLLVKGESRKGAPRVRRTEPEEGVDLYVLQTDVFKDVVANDLARIEPGPGYTHLPDWLPEHRYQELVAEVRDVRKGWQNPGNRPNESWDHLVYGRALCVVLGAERIRWQDPDSVPGWARDWDANPLVIDPDAGGPAPIDRLRRRSRRRTGRVLNKGVR